MTKEEYYSRLDVLRSEESAIKNRILELKNDYLVSVNEPYKHLLGKKVMVTYKGFSDENVNTHTCYWMGYRLVGFGEFRPTFSKVKKDGNMSAVEERLYVKDIVSMEEVK